MTIEDVDIPYVLYQKAPRAKPVPLVFDSPHSGTYYPDDFNSIQPMENIRRLEDTLVDELYAAAPDHGAALLAARFSRMYVDPNRAENDFEPSMMTGEWPGPPLNPGKKGKVGRGVVFTTCPPGVRMYGALLSGEAVWRRIKTCHQPYHAHLRALLDATRARFGCVHHINCHCMGPKPAPELGEPFKDRRPDFILGNMDGRSCGPELMEVTRAFLAGKGYDVRVNEWFKGVEMVRAYGDPANRRHTLQIEINRDLYAVEETLTPSKNFAAFQAVVTELIAELAAFAEQDATKAPH